MNDLDSLEEEVNDATTDVHVQRCSVKVLIAIGRRLDGIAVILAPRVATIWPESTTKNPEAAPAEPPPPEAPVFTRVDSAPAGNGKPEPDSKAGLDDSEKLEFAHT